MGEERIKIEDLDQPESELTPEEAERIQGGGGVIGSDAAAMEQKKKIGGGDLQRQEQDKK